MELLGPIFDVLKCLGGPTCRYIDNYRKLKERMKNLRTIADRLNTLERDIEQTIRPQLRWGKVSREKVDKWLQDVKNINDEIEDINQREQTVSCFSRARLGKDVAQTVVRVKDIIEDRPFTEALVIDDPSIAGVPLPIEHLEGETKVKEDIWSYLMDDESRMIGVWGMGGIGKTTIMKDINNRLLNTKALFDIVIWVTVSEELNIIKIQQEIAKNMKIVDYPESENERAAVLMDELGKRRYVLILDDVWKYFSLLEVGIPEPTLSNGSKLVLTSRLYRTCISMGCKKVVKVRPLSDEESRNLFLKHVGLEVLDVPSLRKILGHVVKECDGLPLAIVVIARSMKGIDDVHEWKNALRELREHVKGLKGTDKEIYERLKFSYDRLRNPDVQNCFLYCSLYPEDHRISRTELIEYWIDEEFLGTGSREELYNLGHSILNTLVSSCLLEEGGGRHDVKMHDVMRDTALYIKSSSPRFMVKAGLSLKELPTEQKWGDFEKVSLMMNDISEIRPDFSPNCEILSTLFLQNNRSLTGMSESFFWHMHRLRILDLSYTSITQLPSSVSNLEKLNALVLRKCTNLRYLPSLEKLKELRKLDLHSAGIEKVPHGLEMLVNLTYLDLSTESLQELPIGILSKLSCLQYLVLYVESNGIKVNGREAAGLVKLETFEGRFHELVDFNTYCKSVEVQRPTSYLLVMASPEAKFDKRKFPEERLVKVILTASSGKTLGKAMKMVAAVQGVESVSYDEMGILTVAGDIDFIDNIAIVRKLRRACGYAEMVSVTTISALLPRKDVILSGGQIRREDPAVLPTDLRCLRIFECHNVRSLSDISLFFQETNELRWCSIHDCREMESVLDLSSSSSPDTPLQNLEYLRLDMLDNLHMLVKVGEASVVTISSSPPLPRVFSHLKLFRIEGCSNMKQLFPFDSVHDLQNLEKLVVRHCGQMKEIIASKEEEENHKGKGIYSPTTFTLPKLRWLELTNLPELKSICSSNGVIICDSLQDIEVWTCPNLKRMPLNLPLFQDAGQSPSCPLQRINIDSGEWWESVEWDYPSAKNILQPFLKILD